MGTFTEDPEITFLQCLGTARNYLKCSIEQVKKTDLKYRIKGLMEDLNKHHEEILAIHEECIRVVKS